MANGTQKHSDLVNWQIEGIRAERVKTQERLTYLEAAEKQLTNTAMTGTRPVKATLKATPTKTRKRRISPDARRKMSEAAKSRWAVRKANTTTGSTATEEVIPPPVV